MIFLFRRFRGFCIWVLFLISLFSFFVVEVAIKDGPLQAFMIFLLFIPATLFVGFAGIINLMDIIVDDKGISRVFFGKSWNLIEWGNMKRIVIFSRFSREDRKMIDCFNLYPLRAQGFRFIPSGKIVFDERMSDIAKFKMIVNKYIISNRIMVERYESGQYNMVNGL